MARLGLNLTKVKAISNINGWTTEALVIDKAKHIHTQLYQDFKLQNWMQSKGAVKLKWSNNHIYIHRPRSWYDWVALDTYRNKIATNMISQFGFTATNKCDDADFYWGDKFELNLEKRANKILKKCGSNSVIENALGTSETCGPGLNPNGVLKNKDTYYEGSVGVVFPGNEMAIFKFDEENNERNIQDENYNRGVMYYEAGEICYNANNPNVFRGYYNNKKSTEETIITHSDGTKWYHTGDLGYMDPAGHSFCLGRKYGLIVRDGHKVWAPKIENIVKSVQGVKDCAIIGVSNKKEKETFKRYLTLIKINNLAKPEDQVNSLVICIE
jgi:acyl-CoA synthetase (AMP-forming)/AMP-acid ligase II